VEKWWKSGTAVVVWIALGTVAAHVATGWRYGFDRDELMALEDARHLAWGYVQYPPMTAFFGRVALGLFGTSLGGFRFFAGVAQALTVVLAGLMAKEMGGGKWAQVTAALAAVPFCLGAGTLMQYTSFDCLFRVWVGYCVVRVVSGTRCAEGPEAEWSGGERWWIGVGVGMGLGMMSKYTMGFLVVGVMAGVLFTGMRRHLKSVWLWLGVAAAGAIFLPNLIWEWRRGFVSLEFLRFLHVRDVREGLTDWFLLGQVELTMLALPLALAGLAFCFGIGPKRSDGQPVAGDERFRLLGWMYLVPLALFLLMRGRDYYLAPAYPVLYAAGAIWVERWVERREAVKEAQWPAARSARRMVEERKEKGNWKSGNRRGSFLQGGIWVALILDIVVAGAVALPIAPVNSAWWRFASRVDTLFPEEFGWPEFVEAVAEVRDRLPESERGRVGILAGNYGEVGALNLYGERYGLPRAISGVNSSWERGYGSPAPDVVIVAGYPRDFLEAEFASCVVGGRVWNRNGIANEETVEDPEIFVCRGLKGGWAEFWGRARRFA
jgi:Dolichyl-phosphate-mannose-protein mannosyltransferase